MFSHQRNFFSGLWRRRYSSFRIAGIMLLFLFSRTRRRSWQTARYMRKCIQQNIWSGDLRPYTDLLDQQIARFPRTIGYFFGEMGQQRPRFDRVSYDRVIRRRVELARIECFHGDVSAHIEAIRGYLQDQGRSPMVLGLTSEAELDIWQRQGQLAELRKRLKQIERYPAEIEASKVDISVEACQGIIDDIKHWQEYADVVMDKNGFSDEERAAVVAIFHTAMCAAEKQATIRLVAEARQKWQAQERAWAMTNMILAREHARRAGQNVREVLIFPQDQPLYELIRCLS